jgi:hypothetical protein
MSGQVKPHGHYRDLISARLEGPLDAGTENRLETHLRRCVTCQAIDRDYRRQRDELRALPYLPPPRDLWARTSSTLDRDLARRRTRLRGATAADRQPTRGLALTTLATLGLAVVLVVLQLPQIQRADRHDVSRAPATPFDVPSQPFAFLASNDDGLALYQTRVDQVCPPSAPDCLAHEDIVPAALALPRNTRTSTLALSPNGKELAIVGSEAGEDETISILLMPGNQQQPPPTRTASPSPAVSRPRPPAAPSLRAPVSAPPEEAIAGLTVLAILSDVRSTGAPPAWSADGSVLAFSAMPADGHHGPDVYVWRPSDPLAQPITRDHNSYFASWSGSRIVVSRVASRVEDDDSPPRSSTVVVDPSSGEQRDTNAPGLWLPAVNSLGTHALTWHGRLEWSGQLVSPADGALYVADWSVLDPFAADGRPGAPIDPQPREVGRPTPPQLQLTPTPAAGATLETDSTSPLPAHSPAAERPPDPVPGYLTAVEEERYQLRGPVIDWQARWSRDGHVVGYWIADAPKASWGRLVIAMLAPDQGVVDRESPLLGPTLARRGFTFGFNRVAWVGPTEFGPEGELRITTWGLDGPGALRLRRFEVTEMVPIF